MHPASGVGQLSLTIGCTVDLLHPASALVRHWWSPFDSSLQQLIVCPRFSSVASLASHWSSRGLFVDHRHWRVFYGRVWMVMLSGEECPNFAISELGGGGRKGGLFQTSRRCCSLCDFPCEFDRAGSEVRWFSVGRGAQLLSGNLCVANRVSGSEIQCNS